MFRCGHDTERSFNFMAVSSLQDRRLSPFPLDKKTIPQDFVAVLDSHTLDNMLLVLNGSCTATS